MLSDFREVFFNVAGEPEIVQWDAARSLKDDLELFLCCSGGFLVYFFEGFPGGFAEN